MLCVGLRDGEDRDLSTMGFTARQSGCLILLRNLLMYFSSTLSWSGSPEKSFFFFFSFLPFCCLEGKKNLAANVLRSQCGEKPEGSEQVKYFLTPLFSSRYACWKTTFPYLLRQVSARMGEFSCPAVQRGYGGLIACRPMLPFTSISREIRAASCLVSLCKFCDTIWNTLTADRKFLSCLLG